MERCTGQGMGKGWDWWSRWTPVTSVSPRPQLHLVFCRCSVCVYWMNKEYVNMCVFLPRKYSKTIALLKGLENCVHVSSVCTRHRVSENGKLLFWFPVCRASLCSAQRWGGAGANPQKKWHGGRLLGLMPSMDPLGGRGDSTSEVRYFCSLIFWRPEITKLVCLFSEWVSCVSISLHQFTYTHILSSKCMKLVCVLYSTTT